MELIEFKNKEELKEKLEQSIKQLLTKNECTQARIEITSLENPQLILIAEDKTITLERNQITHEDFNLEVYTDGTHDYPLAYTHTIYLGTKCYQEIIVDATYLANDILNEDL